MKRIALVGTGGHAKVVWDILRLIGERDGLSVTAVLDDNADVWGDSFRGLTIEGPTQNIARMQVDGAIIALGDNCIRREVFDQIAEFGIPFVNVIHPSAVIGEAVQWGHGIVVCANVVVNVASRIGDNVILNTACTVDHDCVIGAHAHIAPGVHLAGGVTVGEGTLMGIASAAIPGVLIGKWVTVGAGSVVVDNIPNDVTVAGLPARILKQEGLK